MLIQPRYTKKEILIKRLGIVIEGYGSTKDIIAGLVLHVLNEAKNASVSSSVASSDAGAVEF